MEVKFSPSSLLAVDRQGRGGCRNKLSPHRVPQTFSNVEYDLLESSCHMINHKPKTAVAHVSASTGFRKHSLIPKLDNHQRLPIAAGVFAKPQHYRKRASIVEKWTGYDGEHPTRIKIVMEAVMRFG